MDYRLRLSFKISHFVVLNLIYLSLGVSSLLAQSEERFEGRPIGRSVAEQNAAAYNAPDSLDPNRGAESKLQSSKLNIESDNIEADKLRGNQVMVGAPMYAPLAATSDIIYSKVYANQLSHFLGSPMVLYNTTMQLTEPAVATGVNNSVLQTHGALNARYMAEQNFITKLDRDPSTKLVVLRAYTDCVSNLIRPTGAKEDSISWIEAQSRCMADRAKNIEALSTGASGSSKSTNFNKISPNDVAGEGFDFTYDSANPENAGSAGGTPGGGTPGGGAAAQTDRLLLTELIFDKNVSTDVSDLKKYRDSFSKLYGDYELIFDSTDKIRSASRTLTYKLVPPKDANARAELFKKEANVTLQTINSLLIKRCTHPGNANDLLPSVGSNGQGSENSFCNKNREENIKQFKKISFSGYNFSCGMLESIYLTFTYEYPGINKSSADCSKVFNKQTYEALAGDNSGTGGSTTKNLKTGYDFVLAITNNITDGLIYQMVDLESAKVEELTGNSKLFALTLAHKLFREFLGNIELSQLLNNTIYNLQQIQKKMNELNDIKGGQGLTTLYNN